MSQQLGEELGTLYPVTIPRTDDNADIQAALKLYHYGSVAYDETNTNPASLLPSSLAFHLASFQQQIQNINPIVVTSLQTGENLNNKTENGYYSQDSDTDARSANSLNYPVFPENGGVAYAGLLAVVNGEGVVYQTYQMHNVNGRSIFFIRTRTASGGQWSFWYRVLDSAATQTVDSRSANYTVTALDAGRIIRLTGTTSRTFTVANVLSVGQRIDFIQEGEGQLIFAAGSGVDLKASTLVTPYKLARQYSAATVICVAPGAYRIVGELEQ
jgi:hypothetical protein